MPKLLDLATVVRSKNAGPLYITFDVMFPGKEAFERVRESNILTDRYIADLYDVDSRDVTIIMYDIVNALKITIPRKEISGSLADTDVYGCQQQVPLSNIVIP